MDGVARGHCGCGVVDGRKERERWRDVKNEEEGRQGVGGREAAVHRGCRPPESQALLFHLHALWHFGGQVNDVMRPTRSLQRSSVCGRVCFGVGRSCRRAGGSGGSAPLDRMRRVLRMTLCHSTARRGSVKPPSLPPSPQSMATLPRPTMTTCTTHSTETNRNLQHVLFECRRAFPDRGVSGYRPHRALLSPPCQPRSLPNCSLLKQPHTKPPSTRAWTNLVCIPFLAMLCVTRPIDLRSDTT